MNVNFPNREAVVVRDHELRVVRRLPANAEVKVRAGERITDGHVLARTDPKTAAVKIPVSEQLGVASQDAAKYLMRPVGSTFGAGEGMARARKGLRNVVVAAPVAGVLLSLDSDTGIALIAPGGAGDVLSLIPGDIEFVDGKQSVSIRTVGSRLMGIVGFGPNASGVIHVLAQKPGDDLSDAKLTADLAGKIVVGGSHATAATIRRLVELGAVALITGGFVEKEIQASLGVPSEDRLALWRLAPGEASIAESAPTRLTLMATEGFGVLPMHPAAFALLKELHGVPAVLLPATRVTGHLARPQLIVANPSLLDEDAPSGTANLGVDAQVRISDPSSLGIHGVVSSPLRRSRRGDGNIVDVVDVTLANGQIRIIPVANVEIVA